MGVFTRVAALSMAVGLSVTLQGCESWFGDSKNSTNATSVVAEAPVIGEVEGAQQATMRDVRLQEQTATRNLAEDNAELQREQAIVADGVKKVEKQKKAQASVLETERLLANKDAPSAGGNGDNDAPVVNNDAPVVNNDVSVVNNDAPVIDEVAQNNALVQKHSVQLSASATAETQHKHHKRHHAKASLGADSTGVHTAVVSATGSGGVEDVHAEAVLPEEHVHSEHRHKRKHTPQGLMRKHE